MIAGVISYFVAGALIMKLHYKATGTDIIPNKTFWFALPLLLKVSVITNSMRHVPNVKCTDDEHVYVENNITLICMAVVYTPNFFYFFQDGCVFTFSPCVDFIRGKIGKKGKYDEIPP